MIKIITIFSFSILSLNLIAETFSFNTMVKSFRFDADKNYYRVVLKGREITYQASEKNLACFQFSLETQKEVKIIIDDMKIVDCIK